MKNLLKSSLLVIAILMTTITLAKNNDPSIKIRLVESKLIQLTMDVTIKMVEVTVKSSNGEIIYSEKSENLNLSKKYDLKNLPIGSYVMEIESQTKVKLIPFNVLTKSIELNEKKENVYYKPIVRKEGSAVFISKLALNNEALEILLYDLNSNKLFSERLEGNAILERKLNLLNLESGDYSLILRSGGKTFYETIKL